MTENALQILLQCSTFVFSEFPVGQDVLDCVFCVNKFEADIFKVTMFSFVVFAMSEPLKRAVHSVNRNPG